jgi:endonuclease/exonuclease/phosphatase family metal-dependent hydrolase
MTPLKALVVVAAVAALAAPASQAEEPHPFAGDRQVTVMTRNLYLGADLNPIFQAPNLFGLYAAVGAAWTQVQANDYPTRAKALADEIAASRPDLVGLQEAMLFRTDVPPDGPATPAETVAYEFVDTLVRELADRELVYEAVSIHIGTDAELPAGLPPTKDVRLTDRVVVLARADEKTADLKLSNPQSGRYVAALTLPTVAGPLTLTRGWASVDVKIRGKSFRFVTTHLEASTPFVPGEPRNTQARELLAGPANTELPVVLVGDFNSGPGMDLGAYSILTTGPDGFADAWLGGPLTCCHKNDLHNPDPTLTKRIDLILTRGGFETVSTDIVGEAVADHASGLWPSDHAGVVATLQLPS